MKVKNIWVLNAYPYHLVMEHEDGSFALFPILPRKIKESDMYPYMGYHPSKCKGQLVGDYVYGFFGFQKCE